MNLQDFLARGCTLVCVESDAYRGYHRLKPQDLLLEEGQIPPKKAASLGSKHALKPEDLAWAPSTIRNAHNACLEVGVRFAGGYLVPQDKTEALFGHLDELIREFDTKRQVFLGTYEEKRAAWIEELAEWGRIASDVFLSRAQLQKRYYLRYVPLPLGQPAESPKAEAALGAYVGTRADQVLAEVAQAMKVAWQKTFMGKHRVGQRGIAPVERAYHKLVGLMFLDPRLAALVEDIETVLASVPRKGYVYEGAFHALSGLVFKLSRLDATLVQEYAEAATEVAPEDDEEDLAAHGDAPLPPIDDEDDLPSWSPLPVPPAVSPVSQFTWDF